MRLEWKKTVNFFLHVEMHTDRNKFAHEMFILATFIITWSHTLVIISLNSILDAFKWFILFDFVKKDLLILIEFSYNFWDWKIFLFEQLSKNGAPHSTTHIFSFQREWIEWIFFFIFVSFQILIFNVLPCCLSLYFALLSFLLLLIHIFRLS